VPPRWKPTTSVARRLLHAHLIYVDKKAWDEDILALLFPVLAMAGRAWNQGASLKDKGCDIGYALAVSSCEGAKQRGGMHRHSP